jgi:hypothetical protein
MSSQQFLVAERCGGAARNKIQNEAVPNEKVPSGMLKHFIDWKEFKHTTSIETSNVALDASAALYSNL